MKNKSFFLLFTLFLALGLVLTACASTERPFTDVYKGETEPYLLNTRWELEDVKSIDNFRLVVEFGTGGAMRWYNVPDSFNSNLSENSTWERNGDTIVFNARNGFYLYEGKITTDNDVSTIIGRYKTGYKTNYLISTKNYPSGDFMMKPQR